MKWERLTSPEIHALDRNIPVILPIAAIEQHGPHLPLATDSLIADHFMERIDDRMGNGVLTLPTLRVACSGHPMHFTGTLTVSHETFLVYAFELLEAVIRHGFRHLILFNCHGGNQGIGQVLLEKLGNRYTDQSITLITWWRLVADELFQLQESDAGGVGHAGEFETSLLLHFAPEHVRLDQIPGERTNQPTHSWAEGDMLRSGKASYYRRTDEMTKNGVFGDPFLATPAKGLAISKLVETALAGIIGNLSAQSGR